jgi:hypothetical protein
MQGSLLFECVLHNFAVSDARGRDCCHSRDAESRIVVRRAGRPGRNIIRILRRIWAGADDHGDLGYLRVAARTANGRTVYRCAAEPVDAYVVKGGDIADPKGRRCLGNELTANIDQARWCVATNDEESRSSQAATIYCR